MKLRAWICGGNVSYEDFEAESIASAIELGEALSVRSGGVLSSIAIPAEDFRSESGGDFTIWNWTDLR